MKKIVALISSAAMAICFYSASAQAPQTYEFPSTDPMVLLNAAPQSVVKIRMTIQKEMVRSGPYARYAQRLLGVMAPLTDRDTHTILGVAISISNPRQGFNPFETKASPSRAVSLTANDTTFMAITPDRMQLATKSQEEMARDAANAIFRLRKQRLDLISGETGENVFGAGLSAALKEIDRLENEYMALFLGKHSVQTTFKEYGIMPTIDKLSYVAARFSQTAGALSQSDLSGTPIMLVLKSETAPGPNTLSSKSKASSALRIPGMVTCRVMNGTQELVSDVLPIYQFGATVESNK